MGDTFIYPLADGVFILVPPACELRKSSNGRTCLYAVWDALTINILMMVETLILISRRSRHTDALTPFSGLAVPAIEYKEVNFKVTLRL